MIKFRCEHCAQKIGVPDKLLGRHVKCPRCKQRLLVQPMDEATLAAPPAPPAAPKKPPRIPLKDLSKLIAPSAAPPPSEPEASEPTRILRGQALDMDDKPAVAAETPAPEVEADPAFPVPATAAARAGAKQSSLLSLAGIDAKTARNIGLKDKTATPPGERDAADPDAVVAAEPYQDANLPGIAAGFVAVIAGCLIAVGAPMVATIGLAVVGALLAGAGLVVAFTSRRWEQWSAIVGGSFSVIALGVGYLVGASRAAAHPTDLSAVNNARRPPTAVVRPTGMTPAMVLQATVPNRARVTVDSVTIARPELRPNAPHADRTSRLIVSLSITNLGDRPLEYLSWGSGGRIATLSSPTGVQFNPVSYPKGTLLNHPQKSSISPHGTEHDVLVYDPLRPMPAMMSLDLPSSNIGIAGSLHLLLPASTEKTNGS